jgi:outer membrane receptor protein involved in Fe transport
MHNYDQTNSFHYYSDYEFSLTGSPLAPTEIWFLGIYDTSLEEYALFGELGYDITDHFKVTAGGRWFQYDENFKLEQQQPTGFDGGTHLNGDTSSIGRRLRVKLNLSFTFEQRRMVYFTYSGGIPQRRQHAGAHRSVLPDVQPDPLTNYELGAKTEWLDHRVRANIH